jgi:hypothetical protein
VKIGVTFFDLVANFFRFYKLPLWFFFRDQLIKVTKLANFLFRLLFWLFWDKIWCVINKICPKSTILLYLQLFIYNFDVRKYGQLLTWGIFTQPLTSKYDVSKSRQLFAWGLFLRSRLHRHFPVYRRLWFFRLRTLKWVWASHRIRLARGFTYLKIRRTVYLQQPLIDNTIYLLVVKLIGDQNGESATVEIFSDLL